VPIPKASKGEASISTDGETRGEAVVVPLCDTSCLPELDDRNINAPLDEVDDPDDWRLALSRPLMEPGPDRTPRAERPFIDMTCMASSTDAVPGREMRGCRGNDADGEVTADLKIIGCSSDGRATRCSMTARSVRILGDSDDALVNAILCRPDAKSGRRVRSGVYTGKA
jgi:hypothetical protein